MWQIVHLEFTVSTTRFHFTFWLDQCTDGVHYLDKFVVAFVNDILIYSNDEEPHEKYLRMTLYALGEINFMHSLANVRFR